MINEPSVFEPLKFYCNLIIIGQGPTALAVGAGGVVWTFFSPVYHIWGCRVVRWPWINLQCRGIGQGPAALAVGAGGG